MIITPGTIFCPMCFRAPDARNASTRLIVIANARLKRGYTIRTVANVVCHCVESEPGAVEFSS
jgi:hypothetical protein